MLYVPVGKGTKTWANGNILTMPLFFSRENDAFNFHRQANNPIDQTVDKNFLLNYLPSFFRKHGTYT